MAGMLAWEEWEEMVLESQHLLVRCLGPFQATILFLTAAGSLLQAFNSFLPGFLGQNSVGFTTVGDSGKLESIKEGAFRVSLPTILLTSVPSRDCLNLFFGPDSSSVLGLFGKPVC